MLRKRGVTLMELIVVIAIVAILASVAYPNYIRVKMETRRSEAQTAVLTAQGIVERYLSENNKPNIDSGDMALAQFADYDASSISPVITSGGYYVISIVPDSLSYTINATAIASGTTSACTAAPSFPEAYDQCGDLSCWIISIADGQKQSTNNLGVVADATATICW